MLGVLRRSPGPFGSRAEAVYAVESEGFSPVVANWMAINAVRTDAGLRWRLDPDEMESYLRDYFRTDAWGVAESPPAGTDVHFIRALGSSVVDEASVARIRRAARGTPAGAEPALAVSRRACGTGRVFLHEIGGGHWVNTENPDAVHALLAERLR